MKKYREFVIRKYNIKNWESWAQAVLNRQNVLFERTGGHIDDASRITIYGEGETISGRKVTLELNGNRGTIWIDCASKPSAGDILEDILEEIGETKETVDVEMQ